MMLDLIRSETQKHAAGTDLPYNLNDNPTDNAAQWDALGRSYEDPGVPISYRINSHGYRTPEFQSLDWEGSIVCLGDSLMFGTGVAESHTIPHLLSGMAGTPCINLGECNSSNTLMAEHSNHLRLSGIVPKAIVVLLTTIYRTTWLSNGRRVNLNPWNLDPGDKHGYFMHWSSDDGRVAYQTRHAYDTIRAAWVSIPTAFLCYSPDAESACAVTKVSCSPDDLARDGRHPGHKTNATFAAAFANMLPARGL